MNGPILLLRLKRRGFDQATQPQAVSKLIPRVPFICACSLSDGTRPKNRKGDLMALQQTQVFCHRCNQPSLHTRNTYDTPHVLHLLLTLFCCGFWFPIWMLHWLLNSISSVPYRCNMCGQQAGQRAPEVIIHPVAPMRAAAAPERSSSPPPISDAVARAAGQTTRAVAIGLAQAGRALWQQLNCLPGDINAVLKILAGEGNDLVHRFLQVLFVIVLACSIIGAGYTLYRIAF